jgi:hypothetical protein
VQVLSKACYNRRRVGKYGRQTRSRDEGASKDKGASKQKPTFGPTLPPGMAKERREASMNVDTDMTDELG